MTITQLIEKLEKIKDKHGDVGIKIAKKETNDHFWKEPLEEDSVQLEYGPLEDYVLISQ